MNVTLFKRNAQLIIGRKGQEGRLFDKLRIRFTVKKNSQSNPNRNQVSIFNLNPDSRATITNAFKTTPGEETADREKLVMILLAGYKDAVEILAVGDVSNGTTIKEGPDWITMLESGDGEDAFRKANINKSFAPGATFDQILTEITDTFGLPIKTKRGVKTEKFNNGVTLSGSARSLLDQFTKKQGLEWSIQNGEIQIVPTGTSALTSVTILRPDTGLIGSPRRAVKKDQQAFIEFSSMLMPQLAPGAPVQIESEEVNGLFVVRSVIHTGDTREGDWRSDCEAIDSG